MEKRRVLLMVMMLILMSISFEMCFCSLDNDANEKSQSRTDRVNGKLSERFGQIKLDNKKETPDHDHVTVDKAASKAMGPINTAVSGASRNVSRKSKSSSSNETVGFDPREEVGPGMEFGRNRVKGVSRKQGNHNHRMKGEMREIRPIGGKIHDNLDDKAKGVNGNYNQAHRKLQDSHEFTEEAKIIYEAAKENLSQVAGHLGDTMRARSEL